MRDSKTPPGWVLGWPLLLALAVGCGPDPLDLAIEGAVDQAVVPAIEDFAAEATALEAATGTFCASVDQTQLRAVQDQWLSTAESWNRAGIYRIGPLYDDPIVPTIDFIESKRPRGTDYTNTVRETIGPAVEGGEALDAAYFRALNFNRTGMLALEVLLFEDASDPTSNAAADIVAAYQANPRRCEYLQGTAALLAERARGVAAGWTEAYGEAGTPYRDQFLSGTLEDGSSTAVAFLTVIIEHVRYLRSRKLEGVADMQIADAARPETNPYFGNLEVGLLAVQGLFMAHAPDGPSLLDVMRDRGFGAAADALLEAIDEALLWVREESEEGAAVAVAVLDATLQGDVAAALDVELPLNFNDGD